MSKVSKRSLTCHFTATIEINELLRYEEIPIAILDRQVRKLRKKEVGSVKMPWWSHDIEEATWKVEENQKNTPIYFERMKLRLEFCTNIRCI